MTKPFINYSAALAEELKDWTDYAGTAFALGKFLGVYHPGQHLADVLDDVM